MAVLFIDGFDKYGPAGQTTPTPASLLTAGEWTSTVNSTGVAIVAGLSASGQALSLVGVGASTCIASKGLGTNYARLIGGVRFSPPSIATTSTPGGVVFLDGATAQCSISSNITTGTISLRNGDLTSSTIIATSAATVSAGSTHYLEWDITFGNSAAYQVWLDGVSVFTGTGDTTATANNFASVVQLRSPSQTSAALVYDDLYLFDGTGSTCNAPLLNNPIVETALPSADTQKQWTPGGTIIGNDNSITATTNAPGANQIFLRAFTAPANMTLNSMSCTPGATSGTAKFKAVLYAGITAGSARIAEGTEVVATTSGATLTAPFAVGQALTGGVTYAIGFITDTSVVLQQQDTGTTGSKAANTYTSNSPATLPAMTTAQANWKVWGNCTGANVNFASLINNPAIDDIAYINDSTPGHEDLYAFPALSSNPASIACVAYKARVKRSDAGTRTVEVRCLSGAADSAGSLAAATPGSSFNWLDTHFPLDPNTGLPWTGTACNAASGGVKVAS